ncbi:heat-inducible transcriptional repressor HrcA [Pleionea litopenaei]|uniref:Heat-inducible transcription repressor HrcA n=1 Tax=Pleionea litopenaei TaxID=3070815 RepID=A0AA51RRQ8_9GAMM|nr:heat-inducible transcriptional repressor HrcA [Pleionea sp. HL-JVS1]WMS86342.1 heat-inducible transcriptional repressor HrcA [Pleionea sp. HL-JVS1]
MTLSNRAHQLMKVLVEQYLTTGQPIGSSTLAKLSELAVSPATIRNVMGELEQQGFVESPHTSAGRVPTDQGFRLFVDHLLTVQPPQPEQVAEIARQFAPAQTTQEMLSNTSRMLSELTSMAGLVKLPSRKITRIKHIEFMPLTEKRILVVLVLDDHEVQNRVIYSERRFTPAQLVAATNYVNQHLAGRDLESARRTLLETMKTEKETLNDMMQLAIELANASLSTSSTADDYHLSGDKNLLDMVNSEGELSRLKALFNAFQQKQEVLALLNKAIAAEGVQIFIGEECASEGLSSCSVVTAPYKMEGEPVGVLAVVGPTRMFYDRVIPIVDITAKLLSSALNHSE